MPATDVMPSSQVDPQLLLRLLGLAAQRATGTPQAPGTAAPAGMTQARTSAAPDATAAAVTGTAPQPEPRNASPFGMTRGVADRTAAPSADQASTANGTPARPQNAAPAGMTRSQSSEARTPFGGVVATGAQPTPQNPASRNAANPDRPDAPALSANRTPAASEPGNVPPGPMNAPVLSEERYNEQHPLAPNPNPYKVPGIVPRLMAALSGAFATLGGNRAAGQALIDRFLNQQEALREADLNYPQTAEEARHKAYMETLEGEKGATDIENTRQELADRRAAAQRQPTGPSLDQQYADAIEKGDQAGAAKALEGIKNEAGAKTRPVIETLSQRYADAVEKGDQPLAEKLLEGLHALTKATTKEPAGRGGPTSEGGMAYADWRRENPRAPVSDYFKLKNQPKDDATRAKNLDALRKEREQISRDFNSRITDIRTDPAQAKDLEKQRDQQLSVYDRQIHNFEAGYREGDTIPYPGTPSGYAKITRIRPDGMLEVVPAQAPRK